VSWAASSELSIDIADQILVAIRFILIMLYPLIVGYYAVLPDQAHPTDRSVEWPGAILITAAQVVLTLSLSLSISGWTTTGKYRLGWLTQSSSFLLCPPYS
jgi:hypothetical protein